MYVQVEDVKPWYKQFWPWALMVMPATAVVAGLYTYSLAVSTRSAMVVDDYYTEGKAINQSLERGRKAAALGLHGNLSLNGQAARLLLDNPSVQSLQQLELKLYHATLADHDQVVMLHNAGNGVWAGEVAHLAAGRWYVDLLPQDESWRLEGVLPAASPIAAVDLQPAL
ncbi:MAG: FixH family protein [Candidatus Thiothrix singaporensis]|uniref:FixH family protein n=1 Tax=Candidatus Thiothrix singaporensis TaxID=2799669 RepID=A0A7L6AP60_9GAMM|nr:MAG: FixH family protein [Candidatus Thiothrix singaporensis]